jgi:hypothetical protein
MSGKDFKFLFGNPTKEECEDYLRAEGLDPDQIAREGSVFVKNLIERIKFEKRFKAKIICYCGSLRVAMDAFKKAEYEAVLRGEIALLPCCMFVDIQREYGAESDYKIKADDLHKRKIDLCDEVMVLNVAGYIGESTRSEIDYAESIGKPVNYLEP